MFKGSVRRPRVTAAAIATGLGGSLALSLSLGASLSSFTATITNSTNTAASTALAIKETKGTSATCYSYDSTATCSTINKYGGTTTPLSPGGSQTTTVNFANTGGIAVGSYTLAPGTCTASSTGATGSTTPSSTNTDASNLCSVINIAVYKASSATGTALYNGTAAAFTSTISLGSLATSSNQDFTFVVSLPSTASTAVQGQQVSQPLTWTFNQ